MVPATNTQLGKLLASYFSTSNDALAINFRKHYSPTISPTLPRKPKAKRTTPRVTTATFTYRWLTTHPNHITTLYQYLLRAKWIAADTTPDDFFSIFSGQPSTARVKWIEKQSYLYYFIRRAVDKELIYIPNKRKIWQVTESHFMDGCSRPFHEIRKQKVPKTAIPTIEKMLEILLPST